jgi:hypothetical protein
MQNEHETETVLAELARILRRVPADKFQREAVAMVEAGEVPDADLLRRCGIRGDSLTTGSL